MTNTVHPEADAIVRIAESLSDAQRDALSVPHLLVIDNMECVPDMDWPAEMVAYQWPYYDALSKLGLAVRDHLTKDTKNER